MRAINHIDHLSKCFAIIRLYGMKLNPGKCTFGVKGGIFLGFMAKERGIEANSGKKILGKIATLNRFISRSADKNMQFFKILQNAKTFKWGEDCDRTFTELKQYLSSPPLLDKPIKGEPLCTYT